MGDGRVATDPFATATNRFPKDGVRERLTDSRRARGQS